RVGGKTGTSEDVVQLALTYEGARGDVTVSFVGFAPVEDPEIVILVILEAPCRATGLSATGGGMAAPVVGSMLADILPISLGITPQYTEEQLQDLSVYVPRVAERPLFEATNALRNLRLDHEVIGSGERVIAQLPQPNARVSSGTTVRLFTDSEVPDHEVTVPSLSGMTFEGARRTLANRGLFIRTTGVPPSAARAEVSVQAVPEGQQVAYGSVIEVTLIDMAIADMLH
ncbi:MAG: PASTA domain-containing protein, partial [Oscillospiraceae bacterium]|nr:PASTA domain-containing protein [Oscillospiraceae bacterium]